MQKNKGKKRKKYRLKKSAVIILSTAIVFIVASTFFLIRKTAVWARLAHLVSTVEAGIEQETENLIAMLPVREEKMKTSERPAALTDEELLQRTSRTLLRCPLFAHRGFDQNTLENTFAAYDAAIKAGIPQIELDLQASKDGVLYISHDPTLTRVYGLDWKISDKTSAELDAAVLNNGQKLPRLSEVFDRYQNQVIYLIEFKDTALNPDLFVSLMRQYPKLAQNIEIQSFNWSVIESLAQTFPNMFKQLLISDGNKIKEALSKDWVDSIAIEQSLATAENIQAAHQAGKEVWVWTVDDGTKLVPLLDLGADGIITDLNTAKSIVQQNAGRSSWFSKITPGE